MTKKNIITMSKKGLCLADLFGLTVSGASIERVTEEILDRVERGERAFIATPNPEFIVFARKHEWFAGCLRRATLSVVDGTGLMLASWLLLGFRRGVKRRVSGVDLMERLCAEAEKRHQTVYLIGGVEGAAEACFRKLQDRFPRLLGWTEVGPKLNLDPETGEWEAESKRELTESLCSINQKNPDLLFVALGMGKQEKFICDLWPELEVGAAVGVGGAFDYISGRVKRAPVLVRALGLEWFYRLLREPWRWRRQLALLEFVKIVFRERFSRVESNDG